MLTLVCVCNIGELFPGFGPDFLANHFVEMLTMFEEIHRFLFCVGIVGIVLDFEGTIV